MELQRPPSHVRVCFALWLVCAGALTAVASVPAVRRPWSSVLPAERHGSIAVTPPLVNFTTPYISSVQLTTATAPAPGRSVRLTIVSGAEDVVSPAQAAGRALLSIELADRQGVWEWRAPKPARFAPSSSVRVVVEGIPEPSGDEIHLAYDGRAPAVAASEYWWPWILLGFAGGCLWLLSPVSWHAQRRLLDWPRALWTSHRPLLVLLVAAVALRAVLVFRGGQYFDWDEHRYGVGATFLFDRLSTGNFRGALELLLRSPDHPGFRVVGLIPAFFHVLSAYATGQPISEMRYGSGEWLPALLLSLTSVAAIALVYAVAIKQGQSTAAAFAAAFLMFCSMANLIHARHFFPYDAALMLLLTALWLGMSRAGPLRSLLVGLLCGLAFLTYEGYWLMALTVGGLVLAFQKGPSSERWLHGAAFAGGAALLPGLLVTAGWVEGRPFLSDLVRFSGSVTNGDFSEGWLLPWAYQWHLEHGFMIVLLGGMALGLSRRQTRSLSLIWFGTAVALYAGLVLGSNVLHRFVVYDRLARQIFPFMCLAAAPGLAALRWRRVVYVAAGALFAINYSQVVTLRFPRDIVGETIARYGASNVGLATTVPAAIDSTGPLFLPPEVQPAAGAAPRRYIVTNPRDIWIEGSAQTVPTPAGRAVESFTHPRQLPMMQYHGYTPAVRTFMRTHDTPIAVIDTK